MYEDLTIKVNEIPSSFIKGGGLKGYVLDQHAVDWQNVLAAAAAGSCFNKATLEACFNTVMDAAIEGIEHDGHTRQLGDYLELAIGVRGSFRQKGGRFDPTQHKLALNLKPLRRFRNFLPAFKVRIENRAPLVELTSLNSVSRPDSDLLVFGEDMILTGKNLWNCPYLPEPPFDNLAVTYFSCFGFVDGYTTEAWDEPTDNGTRLRIPWPASHNPQAIATQKPSRIDIELRNRAGIPDANIQRHRISAKVDVTTWTPA